MASGDAVALSVESRDGDAPETPAAAAPTIDEDEELPDLGGHTFTGEFAKRKGAGWWEMTPHGRGMWQYVDHQGTYEGPMAHGLRSGSKGRQQ